MTPDVNYKNLRSVLENMEFLDNVRDPKVASLIGDCIAKYGFAPEHDYHEFISYDSKETKSIFVHFGEFRGALLVNHGTTWQVLSEILGPREQHAALFMDLARELFANKGVKKIMVEFPFETRREMIKLSKGTNTVIGNVVEHYYTPIMDLTKWDPTLQGPEMSKLRKAKNRFFRNFDVKLYRNDDILKIPKEKILEMIRKWVKNRKAKDRAIYDSYLTFVEQGLPGGALSILVVINGEVKGLASASSIPNSDRSVYYGVNLHDYSIPELGDFITVVFLDELQKAGFKMMDFGASDEKLLAYKKKFNPVSQYELAFFYVRKAEN